MRRNWVIVMSDEMLEVSVSSDNSVISSDQGTITKLEQKEKVTIKRAANHNEISIMESNWTQIKRKIKLISLQKRLDINAILTGAAIPYAIDIINDHIHKESPNYFPFFCMCFVDRYCYITKKTYSLCGRRFNGDQYGTLGGFK